MSETKRSRGLTALLLAPAGAFLFFLLVLPLVVMVIYSFGVRAPEGGYQAASVNAAGLPLAAA